MIERETLENLFSSIRQTLDPHSPLLWGYFFMHSSKAPLEKCARLLENEGYRVAGIYIGGDSEESSSDPDQRVVWVLHVEKVEAHTVDTLHALNGSFYQFAAKNGLESYDGMDVGPSKMSFLLIFRLLWSRLRILLTAKRSKDPANLST